MSKCPVCGQKVNICDYDGCQYDGKLNKKEFYCFQDERTGNNSHFCTPECFNSWLIDEFEDDLEMAEGD